MSLLSLSPLDGRYAKQLEDIALIGSEYGLIKARLEVEICWLKQLGKALNLPDPDAVCTLLDRILAAFTPQEAQKIKSIEATTAHDVKAVEYFLKEALTSQLHTQFPHPDQASHRDHLIQCWVEHIHFACTSEDINNLAYGLMLKQCRSQILIPRLKQLVDVLRGFAHQYAALPMLARTHGQPATPTTLGKEFANTTARLQRQLQEFEALSIFGKLNGAVGNFNAHVIAHPHLDWQQLSLETIQSLGLTANSYTTQIEPHDGLASYCHSLMRINTIVLDFCRNMWSYISLGYFSQAVKDHEVGSSTMPHKVNPIDFENAEGNLGIANALLGHFADKLPISRFQRDLSDSTVLRNLGVAIGHSTLAFSACLKGLSKVTPHHATLERDLLLHWEILGEAIQTVMRAHGLDTPYEQLKALTRGKTLTPEILRDFIQSLPLPTTEKERLLMLTPTSYLGYAIELAKNI